MGGLGPWRAMGTGDIDRVHGISEAVHPTLPESRAVFADRQALYPAGAFVLERDGTVAGYCIGHPWLEAEPLPLDARIERLPVRPDTFYLHDLALLPGARGLGAAGIIVPYIIRHARETGLASVSLIAVGDSAPFWRRFGFRDTQASEGKLAGYGADARFLTLRFDPEAQGRR